jgi:spore maturation protein CgeB
MPKPKVLVTGPAGAGGLVGFIKTGLDEIGVDAVVLPTTPLPSLVDPVLLRFTSTIPIAGWRLLARAQSLSLASHAAQFNDRLKSKVADWKPDVLISLLCWGDPLEPGLLNDLTGVYKVGWLMDDPFLLSGHLARIVESFDAIYAVDGSWVAPVRLLTGRPVEMLACGACIKSNHPVPKNRVPARFNCDTVFVGTSYQGQSAGFVRRKLLRAIADLNLSIYGDAGWKSSDGEGDPLPECWRAGKLDSAETNLVYNAAAVVLNIHHPQWRVGTSLRTFAVCASGAFQLVDWRPELERFFDLETEIVTYSCQEELREKLIYYRANDSLRLRIARAGLNRVRAEHTYADRLRHILERACLLPSSRMREIAKVVERYG